MFIPSLDSYFLEIKKLKTVKKTLEIKGFRLLFYGRSGGMRSKVRMPLINLELLHLVQLHII